MATKCHYPPKRQQEGAMKYPTKVPISTLKYYNFNQTAKAEPSPALLKYIGEVHPGHLEKVQDKVKNALKIRPIPTMKKVDEPPKKKVSFGDGVEVIEAVTVAPNGVGEVKQMLQVGGENSPYAYLVEAKKRYAKQIAEYKIQVGKHQKQLEDWARGRMPFGWEEQEITRTITSFIKSVQKIGGEEGIYTTKNYRDNFVEY